MHFCEGPFKDTPIMKGFLRVQNYQKSDVRIEPVTAGWEAQTCYAAHTSKRQLRKKIY